MPRRCPTLSRPFFDVPPAFLCAIDQSSSDLGAVGAFAAVSLVVLFFVAGLSPASVVWPFEALTLVALRLLGLLVLLGRTLAVENDVADADHRQLLAMALLDAPASL